MLKLWLTQLRKLFARTDVKCILGIFGLLPLGVAVLISMESGIVQIGDSVFSAMGYGSVLVGLLNSLLLISVTMALTVTALVSREIDTGLDCMYIPKVRSRGQLILTKMAALDVLTVAVYAVMLLSALAGWFFFLKGSDFGSDAIWGASRDENITLMYTFLGSFFETLVMTRVFLVFSLLFKYGKAIVFNFVSVVSFKLLANIEKIRDFIPSYLGGGTRLMELTGEELVRGSVRDLSVLAVYALVLSLVGCILYRRMDLSR